MTYFSVSRTCSSNALSLSCHALTLRGCFMTFHLYVAYPDPINLTRTFHFQPAHLHRRAADPGIRLWYSLKGQLTGLWLNFLRLLDGLCQSLVTLAAFVERSFPIFPRVPREDLVCFLRRLLTGKQKAQPPQSTQNSVQQTWATNSWFQTRPRSSTIISTITSCFTASTRKRGAYPPNRALES
jgi:hypothetical protein